MRKLFSAVLMAVMLGLAGTATARLAQRSTLLPRGETYRGYEGVFYTPRSVDYCPVTDFSASTSGTWIDVGSLDRSFTKVDITIDGSGAAGVATTVTAFFDSSGGTTPYSSSGNPTAPSNFATATDDGVSVLNSGVALFADGVYTLNVTGRFFRVRIEDVDGNNTQRIFLRFHN